MSTTSTVKQQQGNSTEAAKYEGAGNSGQREASKPRDAAPVKTVKATKELAKFVVESSYEKLPGHLVDHLRRLLLDNIGNSAFAAGMVESSPAIRATAIKLNPEGGDFTVIGDSRTYSYLFAALLNGAHAHSMDADDTSIEMVGHPGAAVIATAFAESERTDIQGRAFFEALAVGYEVECRAGAALAVGAYSRGLHVTGVAGIFGAVAVLAKLRGLTADVIESAWGIALSKAAGSMQYLENGSWNKRLHPGFAAHDAFIVASLAEAGVIGATSAFEGEYGLLHAYSPKPIAEELTDGLGSRWITLKTGIKPYPCCRLTHAAIDTAIKLRENVDADDRASATLTVEINAVAMQIVGGKVDFKIKPRSTVDAQFSICFTTAEAWIDGVVDWDSYNKIHDETLLGITKRMVLKQNDSLPNGTAILTVDAGGKHLTERLDVPSGEPSNWMGDAALKAKFLKEAGRVFGAERASDIFDSTIALDVDNSVVELVRMTRTHTK